MNMMSGLLGTSPDRNIQLNNAYPSATAANQYAVASYRIGSDKKVYLGSGTFSSWTPPNSGTLVEYETWCGPGQEASAYEVRATMVDQVGDINYGAYGVSSFAGETGAWLNLGATREWSVRSYAGLVGLTQTSPKVIRTLTIEIRNATTKRRVAVATVVLTAQRYS